MISSFMRGGFLSEIQLYNHQFSWRRHDMETLSALLVLYVGNPLVTGGLPSQRTSNAIFDSFVVVRPKKLLNEQSSCPFLFKKIHLMMSSAMLWPFYPASLRASKELRFCCRNTSDAPLRHCGYGWNPLCLLTHTCVSEWDVSISSTSHS